MRKIILLTSAIAGAAAIGAAAHFGPATSPETGDLEGHPALLHVSAATVGAADGMKESGWSNADLEARVDRIRHRVPTGDRDGTAERLGHGERVSALAVYRASRIDAVMGAWDENALEGYLRVAEMSAEDVLEANARVQEICPPGKESLSYVRIARAVSAREDEIPAIGAVIGPRGDASSDYARAALSQTISVQYGIASYLRPALDMADEMGGGAAAAKVVSDRAEMFYMNAAHGIVQQAGFLTTIGMVANGSSFTPPEPDEDAPSP